MVKHRHPEVSATDVAMLSPPQLICAHCATPIIDRLFVRRGTRHLCELCLLKLPPLAAPTAEQSAMYASFVEALTAALDLREHETGLHSKRVACHTQVLARRITDDPEWLHQIYWGALLHDIGKIGVPDHILLKQGALSEQEWPVMRRHVEDGHNLVSNLAGLHEAAQIVHTHEERYDGSGYPRGLRGSEIPLGARLFAIIDTLDAMTSDRCYRRALSFDTAKKEIVNMAGSQFDPLAVDIFLAEEATLREMVALKFSASELATLME